MRIIRYGKDAFPYSGCVIAIGFFDGVHIAHRELITEAQRKARSLGIPSGVFTFVSEGAIKENVPRIYTTDEKLSLIGSLGIDFAVVADFADIAGVSAAEFTERILVRELCTEVAVVGYNFRYGTGALGNSETLSARMKRLGKDTVVCPPMLYLGEPVSSSVIRRHIDEGRMEEAERLLGAPYFIEGTVVHGRGIGHASLGFPTVNLEIASGRVSPKRGVYRVGVLLGNEVLSGVANVGICPTYGGVESHVEVHITDFSADIYGERVRVYFLGYLRNEIVFETENALKMQINIDKNRAIKENGDLKWIITGQS